MSPADSGDCVFLIAASADRDAAEIVTNLLHGRGVELLASLPTTDAHSADVIVLVSQAAAKDADWVAGVAQVSDSHLIPIRVSAVENTTGIPAAVSTLNWIAYEPQHPDSFIQTVESALRSDLETYQAARSLEVKADAWARSGYSDGLLVRGTRKWAAEARDVHAAATADPILPQSDMAARFIDASLRSGRRQRRRRVMQAISVVSIVAVVGVLVTFAVIGTRAVVDSQRLAATASVLGSSTASLEPEYVAMLSAATLTDAGSTVGGSGALSLQILGFELTKRWAAGGIGVAPNQAYLWARPLSPANEVLVSRPGGLLSRVDLSNSAVISTVAVGTDISYFDSTDDGSVIAGLSDDALIVVTNGSPGRIPLPFKASRVVLGDRRVPPS